MPLPAVALTALTERRITADLWLEIEGIGWAFGIVTRAASWFAGRAAAERRLGIAGVMLEVPAIADVEVRPLDGEATVGSMSTTLLWDNAGALQSLIANAARTDHRLALYAPAHAVLTAYALNDVVALVDVTPDEWILRCSTAGTSGAVAPNPAPTVAVGDTVSDGASLVWTVIGKAKDLGATGAETFLPYLGTADAVQYPTDGGTIYIGRETFAYTARVAGTNGAGRFEGVTRGMYALPGRGAKWPHNWGDLITPYPRFAKTRCVALYASLNGVDSGKFARWAGSIDNAQLALRGSALTIDMESTGSGIRIKAFGGQRRGKLSAGVANIVGAYTAKSASEPTAETSKLRVVAASMAGVWTAGTTITVRVEGEYFAGTIAADATGTYIDFSGTGARGLFSTEVVAHPLGAEVVEIAWTAGYDATGTVEYRFSKFTAGDHPLEVALCWLTSRLGDGANGTYDVLPEGWGAGIDQARFDLAGIDQLKRSWLPGQRDAWRLDASFDLRDEMVRLLKPQLCYPAPLLDDVVTIKRLSPPIPGLTVRAISVTGVLTPPGWDANLRDVVGRVLFQCDYDPDEDKARQTVVGELQGPGVEAQEFYQQTFRELTVEARGAWTGNDPGAVGFFGAALRTNALDAAMRYIATVRDRYARPFPRIEVECSYQYLDVEPGDIVTLTMAHLPDIETGAMALDGATCEVLRKQIDDARGVVALTLLQTPAAEARLLAPALPVSAVVGTKVTLYDAGMTAEDFDAYAPALFAVGDVLEVWTSDLLTSRGTATVTVVADSSTAGGVDVTVGSLPAGTTAGDIVMPAAYDSATASQRARYAFLADAAGTLGAGAAAAHLYAI